MLQRNRQRVSGKGRGPIMDKWLGSNLVVKILAVVLAIMLWTVVNQERIFEKKPTIEVTDSISKEINRVPIAGHLPNNDYVIVDMPSSIDVVLRGKREVLAGVTPNSYEVYVDLNGYGEGKHRVPVQTKGFPAGVDIELRPATLEVQIEAKQVMEMPVAIEFIGKAKEGYTIGTPVITPATVQVKAAGSQLKRAAVAKVFINIGDATQEIRQSISLKVLDANGNEVPAEIDPAKVEIVVPVTPPSVTIPLQAKIVGEPPVGYAVAKVDTNVNGVTLFGPTEVLNGIAMFPLPAIDISQMNSTQSIPLNLTNVGTSIEGVVGIIPNQVVVTITIVPSEVLALRDQPIQIDGLSDDHKVTFVTPIGGKLDITLEGAPIVLQSVTGANVRARIDVNKLTLGENEVPIIWELPAYTKLTKDLPKAVKVLIQARSDETSTSPVEPDPQDPDHQDPKTGN